MATVKKSDIYAFLDEKKSEVYKAKVTPLHDEWIRLKDEYYQAFLKKSGLLNPEFQEATRLVKQTLENARDNMTYGNYYINDVISGLSGDFAKIIRGLDYDSVISIREARENYNTVDKAVEEEFAKLNRAVKATSSTKQIIKMLNTLGFDTSKIVAGVKNEVMTLSVNKELLGLPEQQG